MASGGNTSSATAYSSINGDLIMNDLVGMAAGDRDAYRNITDLFLMFNSKIVAQQIELENLISVNDRAQAKIKTVECAYYVPTPGGSQ